MDYKVGSWAQNSPGQKKLKYFDFFALNKLNENNEEMPRRNFRSPLSAFSVNNTCVAVILDFAVAVDTAPKKNHIEKILSGFILKQPQKYLKPLL